MTLFDKRNDAFEAKFAHDAEMQFKAAARRNKLLGLWAAELAGKQGDDALAYAKEVVASDMERPGDDDVIEKVLGDLVAAGHAVTRDEVVRQLQYWAGVAREQLLKGE